MPKLLIRFAYTHHDTGWVAHADVPVAEGVYVTGWRIHPRTDVGRLEGVERRA